MAGSFTARHGRRIIISQLFVTLSDRLLAVTHAETLSNSAGMVHEFPCPPYKYHPARPAESLCVLAQPGWPLGLCRSQDSGF